MAEVKNTLFILRFRVAVFVANISKHLNSTMLQRAKTTSQQGELRALLFTMSVWVL